MRLFIAVLLLIPSVSFAKEISRGEIVKTFAKTVTELVSASADQNKLMARLAVFNGIDRESVANVEKDLSANKKIQLKFEIKHDQYFINGYATGLEITSYNPMTLKYQSHVWAYDSTRTFDENYFSLKRIILPKSSALWKMLVPDARADEDVADQSLKTQAKEMMNETKIAISRRVIDFAKSGSPGAMIGKGAILITLIAATAATAPAMGLGVTVIGAVTVADIAVGTLTSTLFGGIAYQHYGIDAKQLAGINQRFASGHPQFSCTPSGLSIFEKGEETSPYIFISLHKDLPSFAKSANGENFHPTELSPELKQALAVIYGDCSDIQKAAMSTALQAGAQSVEKYNKMSDGTLSVPASGQTGSGGDK